MVNEQDIAEMLQSILDPELPISIVDLGLIEKVEFSNGLVQIDLLPTFIGCLALPAIAKEIETKLGALDGIQKVEVTFVNDPPWHTQRITEQGRKDLSSHGIAVPDGGGCCGQTTPTTVDLSTSIIPCPWCDSQDTKITSSFGPTRCRSIHFCNACRQPFERMKMI